MLKAGRGIFWAHIPRSCDSLRWSRNFFVRKITHDFIDFPSDNFLTTFEHKNVDRWGGENFTIRVVFPKNAFKNSRSFDFRPLQLRNDYKCQKLTAIWSHVLFSFLLLKSIQCLSPRMYAAYKKTFPAWINARWHYITEMKGPTPRERRVLSSSQILLMKNKHRKFSVI